MSEVNLEIVSRLFRPRYPSPRDCLSGVFGSLSFVHAPSRAAAPPGFVRKIAASGWRAIGEERRKEKEKGSLWRVRCNSLVSSPNAAPVESISSDPYGNLNAPLLEPWVYVQTNPQPMSGIPISEWGPSGSSLGAAAKARLGAQRTADADTSRRHQRLGSKRNAHPAGKKSRKGDVRLGTPSPGNVRCYPRRRKVFACAARRGQRGAQLKRTPLATLR